MNRPTDPAAHRTREQFPQEADHAGGAGDFEALARDTIVVRSLDEVDLGAVMRIDSRITGRDRGAYLRRKAAEALEESGVRVSLVAEQDRRVVGFVMARVDLGEFGQTAAAAVLDTLGVDPAAQGQHVGRALVSQLLANLAALRVESVRTELAWDDFGLARFLAQCGFVPAQRLALSRPIG